LSSGLVTIAFYRYSIDLMLRTGAKPAPTPGGITRRTQYVAFWGEAENICSG